jgi:hypothetical protein
MQLFQVTQNLVLAIIRWRSLSAFAEATPMARARSPVQFPEDLVAFSVPSLVANQMRQRPSRVERGGSSNKRTLAPCRGLTARPLN